MKAFLSHSSRDKELVLAVAQELGRPLTVVDVQAFETGEDFKRSIERGLDNASVFVLFVSKPALASIWVNFEIDEAWIRKLRGSISTSLVYIIDQDLRTEDLPEWLARGLIRREYVPKVIARDIRHHLTQVLVQRQRLYFVGRSGDVEALEQVLTPLDAPSPHAFFVTGLPGIGRRTLVRQATPSTLTLRKQVEIRIGEGDSIQDICAIVADFAEPYSTRARFEAIVQEIKALPPERASSRVLENLRAMVRAGELPMFFDEGGVLDADGFLSEPMKRIVSGLAPNDEAYCVLISHRRPHRDSQPSIPVVTLDPLSVPATRRLIGTLAGHRNLSVRGVEVNDLADYVAGYPPAAHFAVEQALQYGIELVLRDKEQLTRFRAGIFLQHFARIILSPEECDIMRLLAFHSPLPLGVIANVLRIDPRALASMLVRLIDFAFVIATEENLYRIADPLTEATSSAFGVPTNEEHRAVARSLSEVLGDMGVDSAYLQLSRVMFRSASMAGDREISASATHLAGDLIKLAQELYHARRYSEVVTIAQAALDERRGSITARGYLVRALIQEERWDEAEEQIGEISRYAPERDVLYLRGFLERKRGNLERAIDHYSGVQKLGRRGAALSRELAMCYCFTGNYEEASRHIEIALGEHGDNRFVIDLAIRLAVVKKDEVAARRGLLRLQRVENAMFFMHRTSRVEFAFGKVREAREAAEKAVGAEANPPFEVLAQLAYCQLEMNDARGAERTLELLDRKYGHIRNDVRNGLRCRLDITRGRHNEALARAEQIRNKESPFYKAIRRDALAGSLRSGLRDAERSSREEEIAALERELGGIGRDKLAPADLDSPSGRG